MRQRATVAGIVLCHVAAAAAPGECDNGGPISLFVASSRSRSSGSSSGSGSSGSGSGGGSSSSSSSSPGSSDEPTAEDGSILRPFRSLARARDEVRALRHGPCGLPVGGVTINLRGGVYALSAPLQLTAADSGTARSPVTWRAHASEPVLISGGVEIPRAAFSAVPARPHVLQVNVTDALGVTDFGAIQTGGADGPPVHTDLAELFFGGQPMHLARWPNQYPNASTQWAYTGPGYPAGCTTACTCCSNPSFLRWYMNQPAHYNLLAIA